MAKTSFATYALLTVALLSFSTTSMSRDISSEQSQAYEARKLYNKNKSKHKDLLKAIELQEKRVADAQARLNDLKAQEAAANTEVNQSKMNLDAKVQQLNDVWDSRNR